MNITLQKVDEDWVALPDGPRIDALHVLPFKEEMRRLIAGCSGDLILDLRNVVFIDSSGLGAVVALRKMMGRDRQLALANLQPLVAKVFHLTHLDELFEISNNADIISGAA